MTHLFVRRLLPLLLAAAIVPVGFWGVGLAQAQAPKTLVIAIGADQTGLDPQTVENNESGFVMSTIFDSIVNYKPGSSDVGPGLAESWTISPDGKVYTFHIRHNVNFQDGTPMNARTVAQDVDRAINPNNPCYVLARKDVDTYDDFTFGSVKDGTVAKMDVLDDYTLRFTLPQPNAPFITSLAMVWQGIMSPAATKQYNCDASQHPVGTGPFKFVEAVRNDHITLDANAAYWGGRPKVDRIIFQIVPGERHADAAARAQPGAGPGRRAAVRLLPRHRQQGPEALLGAGPDDPGRRDVERPRSVQGRPRAAGDELRGRQGRDQQGPLRRRDHGQPGDAARAVGLQQVRRSVSVRPREGEAAAD